MLLARYYSRGLFCSPLTCNLDGYKGKGFSGLQQVSAGAVRWGCTSLAAAQPSSCRHMPSCTVWCTRSLCSLHAQLKPCPCSPPVRGSSRAGRTDPHRYLVTSTTNTPTRTALPCPRAPPKVLYWVWALATLINSLIDWPLRRLSGGLLASRTLPVRSATQSYDAKLAAELWDASSELAGLPKDVHA
jgi:hypothetical protein